ncbi:MFS transporter [Alicyclobacillus tolerans]|uniref:MFS transporter n=1 Tax=Alicyclobacillus tolerans TaxID=90970 RepID=UPI003B77B17F
MNEDTATIQSKAVERRDLIIVLTASVGLFLSTLDTGIINVALPSLERKFDVGISEMAWSITLYLLLLSATIVIFGRISDRIGRLKVYFSGLVLFAVASLLCGFASSAVGLILFRGIQGIGAAMLQATAAAIITTQIPRNRQGAALGTLGMMLGLGPVLGPSVGGLLLSFVGWRWIFWINIPICVMGLIGTQRLMRIREEQRNTGSLNLVESFLLGASVFGIIYGLSATGSHGVMRIFPYCLAVVAFIIYLVREARTSQPIVKLPLFRKGIFSVSIFSVTVLGFATAIAFVVPPYFLEQIVHISPWQVGLVNLATPLGLVLLSRASGRLIGTWGARRLMAIGLGLMFVALATLSAMQVSWMILSIVALLLLYGFGAGIFVPANLSAIMGAVESELQGTIGAVQRMVQNIGIALGTSVAALFIRSGSEFGTGGYISAFRESWMVAGGAVLICLFTLSFVNLMRERVR